MILVRRGSDCRNGIYNQLIRVLDHGVDLLKGLVDGPHGLFSCRTLRGYVKVIGIVQVQGQKQIVPKCLKCGWHIPNFLPA
jgi:hypothetical protein